MSNYPTPHINCTPSDFAKTVLMPGDPLRSKFIAENYLKDIKLVNNVRGVQGYTGTYEGERVSVMASGMGMPSIAIYATELYSVFGIENIIRVGTAGGISRKVKLRDTIIGMGACTDSNFMYQYALPGTFAPVASFELMLKAVECAKKMGIEPRVGCVLSSDVFYNDYSHEGLSVNELWAKMGVLAVEMETAALYATAAKYGKNALAVFTVSDDLITGERTTAEERQTTFDEMIRLALNTAASV